MLDCWVVSKMLTLDFGSVGFLDGWIGSDLLDL